MSQEAAQKFLDHVDKNEDAQTKLKKAFGKIVEVGKEHGYEFSQAELNQELRKRWGVTKPPQYSDPDTCTICI